MKGHQVISLDASTYALRAGLFMEGSCESSFEGAPHHFHDLVEFLDECQCHDQRIPLVASPLDRWPEGLERALREHNVPVTWLSPELMRGVAKAIVPWNRERRLHRAGLLAYLADPCSRTVVPRFDAKSLVLSWEAARSEKVIESVRAQLNWNGEGVT